jgi:hypothetical protein
MRQQRLVLFSALIVMTLATFVRVRYEKLEWGGYWSVDVVAPWRR